jgi:hypothetical protein
VFLRGFWGIGVFVVVFVWSGCGGLGGKGGKWVVLKTVADFMHGFRLYFFGGRGRRFARCANAHPATAKTKADPYGMTNKKGDSNGNCNGNCKYRDPSLRSG